MITLLFGLLEKWIDCLMNVASTAYVMISIKL